MYIHACIHAWVVMGEMVLVLEEEDEEEEVVVVEVVVLPASLAPVARRPRQAMVLMPLLLAAAARRAPRARRSTRRRAACRLWAALYSATLVRRPIRSSTSQRASSATSKGCRTAPPRRLRSRVCLLVVCHHTAAAL